MKNINNMLSKLNTFLIILLVVGFMVNFYYSDRVSTAGENYSQIEDELKSQKLLNEDLVNEYLSYTSLSKVYETILDDEFVVAEYEYYQIPEFALR